MLSVLRVHLPSKIPMAGCELSPYVLLRRPDLTTTTDDIPEVAPVDGYFLRWRWYRIQSDQWVAVCSVHPSKPAAMQCLGCVKADLAVTKSYHCSPKCFSDSWCHHRTMHTRARAASDAVRDIGAEGSEDLQSQRNSHNGALATLSGIPPPLKRYPNPIRILSQRVGEETSCEVGLGRTYIPTADDVGHRLRLECVPMDANTARAVGSASVVLTDPVIEAPSPTPRRLISADGTSAMDVEGRIPARGTFSLLSYNVLADLYADSDMYSYCPPWALHWTYRKQNLLMEILSYGADILCLQEVQSDHFKEFFVPELEKHGYAVAYKKKTREVYTGTSYAIDGCATFFRRDRFSLVKKYEVDFNKATQSFPDVFIPSTARRAHMSPYLKDNVALIIVLEALEKDANLDLSQAAGKQQLLCVANTHIHENPKLNEIKQWQVYTLMKILEKIASSASIPMLVAGDFNAVPGSEPYLMVTKGRVEPFPELGTDPLSILRDPNMEFYHQIPLVSAYSQFARMHGMSPAMEQHRRRMDPTTNEPLFTSCNRDFLGTLDYIFYTADSLDVESLLELLDKATALPTPEWSSDHIALLVEFRFKSLPAQ